MWGEVGGAFSGGSQDRRTCHYDVVGLKSAHVAIPRVSYLYTQSPTITQSEVGLEGRKAEGKMFKTLDDGRRHGEWQEVM